MGTKPQIKYAESPREIPWANELRFETLLVATYTSNYMMALSAPCRLPADVMVKVHL